MTETMNRNIDLHTIITDEFAGKRLDQSLASLYPEHSRARIQKWIQNGMVLVDGETVVTRHKLRGGEEISIQATIESQTEAESEAIQLDIIHEDEGLLVVNKPAGLVVHPGAGNPAHTLLNALLHHQPALKLVARAGIVHRLDKSTTGLMVVAKTPETHTALVEALQARAVKRQYQALVKGYMTAGGTINEAIGRHPKQRKKMAVIHSGKEAITHYRLLEKFSHFSLVNCQLETGRTHQIRVHLAHIHHPIIGDPVYGGRLGLPKACPEPLKNSLLNFKRQALHAWQLGLQHPLTGEYVEWQCPLPEDFIALLEQVRDAENQLD